MKTVHLVGCIKRDIMRWVNRYSLEGNIDLSTWYCGITHISDFSKLEQYIKDKGIQNVYFRRWLANDLNGSHEILKFFIRNGMKSNPVKAIAREDAIYVYIVNINPKIMDDILKLLS